MRLYTWQDSPVEVPVLSSVRICPERHYMEAEHLSTRRVQRWDEGGRPLAVLAGIAEFSDPSRAEVPLHEPLRKK